MTINAKKDRLVKILNEYANEFGKLGLAFSGGVDSAYLLYVLKSEGIDFTPYFVKGQFQPQFELEDGKRLDGEFDCSMKILNVDILQFEDIIKNPTNRCYYCKQQIMSAIKNEMEKDGITALLDGSNASDDAGDRPGMRAFKEAKGLSPLREAGLTKSEIRELSRANGLFTWDKPSYACLATRIKTGEVITSEKLQTLESAEDMLFKMGYINFRVRLSSGQAKLQFDKSQLEKANLEREKIFESIGNKFKSIVIDSEGR